MNIRVMMMAGGAALAVMAAGQSAQAQSCGSNPTGEVQIEVPSDDGGMCPPTGGSAYVSTAAQNANGVTYDLEATVPDGNDYLQIGEVVEVTLDYDNVVATLRSNEKDAVTLAHALGIRSADQKGATTANAKLTDTEYHKLATHIQKAALQSGGRVTGRSNPAPNSTTRRADGFSQALERAINALGRNMPTFSAWGTMRTYHPNGQVKMEMSVGAEVRRR